MRRMSSRIPTLDIRRMTQTATHSSPSSADTYREWGFAGIRDHGISAALIDRAYDAFKRFFALPAETKMKYHLAGIGGARGYTPFGIETAKDSKHPDLKEFWHIGREIPRDSKYAQIMPPNVWPSEVPAFRPAGYALYDALDRLGSRVLRALALYIGLPEDWFEGTDEFRQLDPAPDPLSADHRARCAERSRGRARGHQPHHAARRPSAEGLEVCARSGEWVPFTADADTIVVNIGDMLQRLTNHVYPSTTHRVVNPQNESSRKPRYSVPFFLHPNPDFVIDVLPSCVDAGHPKRYAQPITATTICRNACARSN